MLAVRADVMSRRSRRGEVAKRGSLVAVVTADFSRAEFFLVFSKELPDLRGSRLLLESNTPHRRGSQGPYLIGSILEVLVLLIILIVSLRGD